MNEEPAEVAEEFQYDIIEMLKKINSTLEKINANLELIAKK